MASTLHLTQPDGIIPFPDFIFAEMARRGLGSIEVESSATDVARQPPNRWEFRRDGGGEIEVIAETRPPHFRTILARFAHVCGITPYGGEASVSIGAPFPSAIGTHHYSVTLRNSLQSGVGIRILLHAIDGSPNPSRFLATSCYLTNTRNGSANLSSFLETH